MTTLNVTKTYLPPLDEYLNYLKEIWDSGWITNQGPVLARLTRELVDFSAVEHLLVTCNGTLALQLALRALDVTKEVIVTPFTYVATVSSIVWEHCRPIFADIDPETLCISPAEIEKVITDDCQAIMAVHVYGNCCDLAALDQIKRRNNLKLIYDAAHAFGCNFNGRSLLSYGDASVCSFHATKLFHTCEGGAVTFSDEESYQKASYLMNFGHKGYEDFWGLGINAKCSELHAALGLCVLGKISQIISDRRRVSEEYDRLLSPAFNGWLKRPRIDAKLEYNFAYYPVLFRSEDELLKAVRALRGADIVPRRYFYPCLTSLNYVGSQSAPVAEDVSRRILCLPIAFEMSEADITRVADLILSVLGS